MNKNNNIIATKDVCTKIKLTSAQKKKLAEIGKTLQVNDINSVTNYGCELQNIMSHNADVMVAQTRSSNVDEIGELVTSLLAELNMIDIDEISGNFKGMKKFFKNFPIIGSLIRKAENQMLKYDTVKENLNDIEKKIFATRMIALRDNNSLQMMFDNNIEYIKQIEQLIMAGCIRLDEIKKELLKMQDNSDFEVYQKNEYDNFIVHLDKKIDDLSRVQYMLKQNLLQIQAVQSNNISIAEKANDICTTTIPLWKSQISLAIALSDQKKNIDAQRRVSDATNELLRREAQMLKQNSIDVAKENERSIIDIETLRETQQLLIDTVYEVRKIHEEGAQKRIEAQQQLLQLANDFKNGLNNMLTISTSEYIPKKLKEFDSVEEASFEEVV